MGLKQAESKVSITFRKVFERKVNYAYVVSQASKNDIARPSKRSVDIDI